MESSVVINEKTKKERVPQSVIDSILKSVSILETVEESIQTEVPDMLSMPCPFHLPGPGEDENPLTVDLEQQLVGCIECDFQASAIGWLMYHDGLTFEESLFVLSSRSDIDISQWVTEADIDKARQKKQQLQSDVTRFYQTELAQSEKAQTYLKSRGLSPLTIETFQLGYSSPNTAAMKTAFPKLERQLWSGGLMIRRNDKRYSYRFRDRIMFPIKDATGITVGFGGRAFEGSQLKYLNSPSSPSFVKSQILYGLHEAIVSPDAIKRLLLVEGYMDVLALHDAGVSHPVATLGTAPSKHHLKTIFSHTDQLLACFDGDAAGQRAATRLLDLALPMLADSEQLHFVELPPGSDPDSLINENGRESFESLLANPIPAHDFLLTILAEGLDLDSIGGKAALYARAAQRIEKIKSQTTRASLIDRIESIVGLAWDAVNR